MTNKEKTMPSAFAVATTAMLSVAGSDMHAQMIIDVKSSQGVSTSKVSPPAFMVVNSKGYLLIDTNNEEQERSALSNRIRSEISDAMLHRLVRKQKRDKKYIDAE